jgi:uncharacterized membrane protein
MAIVALLVLGGMVARIYDVGRMVVWHDEVFTAVRVFGYAQEEVARFVFSGRSLEPGEILAFQRRAPGRGWGDTLNALVEHPEHSPLYYLAARLMVPAVSEPMDALRGTSAVLSLLLIPGVFWLARELLREPKAPWVAAALVAVSPLHLLYAQEAREYALWTVVTVAASAAFLRALRGHRAQDWVVYGLLVAVGLYSHLLFVLVLFAHVAYGILSDGVDLRRLYVIWRSWAFALVVGMALFLPWILVLVDGRHRVEQSTGWMFREVGAMETLEAWGMHLVRTFADFPAAGSLLHVGLLPVTWILWVFVQKGPPRAVLFCTLLFGVLAAAVLLPDLIWGGSRSLHARYVLPCFLAIELAAAWVLARAWDARMLGARVIGRAAFGLILGAGVWSGLLILAADTWWSKNFSEENRAVAHLINAAERPLVVATHSGVSLGEVISLAYDLRPGVRIWGEPRPGVEPPMADFARVFALTPSAEVRLALQERGYWLAPVLETWQWFEAEPHIGKGGP